MTIRKYMDSSWLNSIAHFLRPLKQEYTYTKIALDVITTTCKDIAQRNTLLATKLRYSSTEIQSEIRFITFLCLYGDIHIRNYRNSPLGSIRHLMSFTQHLVASGRDSAICVNSQRYTHGFKTKPSTTSLVATCLIPRMFVLACVACVWSPYSYVTYLCFIDYSCSVVQ